MRSMGLPDHQVRVTLQRLLSWHVLAPSKPEEPEALPRFKPVLYPGPGEHILADPGVLYLSAHLRNSPFSLVLVGSQSDTIHDRASRLLKRPGLLKRQMRKLMALRRMAEPQIFLCGDPFVHAENISFLTKLGYLYKGCSLGKPMTSLSQIGAPEKDAKFKDKQFSTVVDIGAFDFMTSPHWKPDPGKSFPEMLSYLLGFYGRVSHKSVLVFPTEDRQTVTTLPPRNFEGELRKQLDALGIKYKFYDVEPVYRLPMEQDVRDALVTHILGVTTPEDIEKAVHLTCRVATFRHKHEWSRAVVVWWGNKIPTEAIG